MNEQKDIENISKIYRRLYILRGHLFPLKKV